MANAFQTLRSLKTVFTFLLLVNIVPEGLFAYDSSMLKGGEELEINVYYSRHLEKLRKSVKPRYIHLIDTRSYMNTGNLLQSGILFTYKNYQARNVYFISSKDHFRKHRMLRNEKGVWYYIMPREEYVESQPDTAIEYKFVVDGLYVADQTHQNYRDDRAGGIISLFYLTGDMLKPKEGVLFLEPDTRENRKVLFRLYAPNASFVSLVGSFNNWDSEMDPMKRTRDGYFEVIKSLPSGEYTYMYKIDGVNQVDQQSHELKFHSVFGKVGYFLVK